MEDGFKTCPFCQEKIRAHAIKCRFCGEKVETPPRGMDRAWIEIEGRAPSTDKHEPEPFSFAKGFLRHWHGELSFVRSFWVIAILLTGALALIAFFTTPLFRDQSLSEIPVSALLFYTFWPLLLIWQFVGAWRNVALSGEGFTGLKNKGAGLVLLCLSISATGLLCFRMIPQAGEFLLAKWHDRRILPHQIQTRASGTEIEFRGGLESGAAEHFRTMLAHLPSLKLVHLNSPGGRIDEALQMAQLVSERRLGVHIAERCLGAAALILIAGVDRTAATDARIGFERPDAFYRPNARHQKLETLTLSIFREAGIKKAFAARALTTPRAERWFPTHAELLDGGVLTASQCPVNPDGPAAAD